MTSVPIFRSLCPAVLCLFLLAGAGAMVGSACSGRDPGLLVYGGTIVTMEAALPEAGAMLVRDGRIVAVGAGGYSGHSCTGVVTQ